MKKEIYKRNYVCDVHCGSMRMIDVRGNETTGRKKMAHCFNLLRTFKDITINLRGKWILNDILSWSNEVVSFSM